jgi:hypothetical protein
LHFLLTASFTFFVVVHRCPLCCLRHDVSLSEKEKVRVPVSFSYSNAGGKNVPPNITFSVSPGSRIRQDTMMIMDKNATGSQRLHSSSTCTHLTRVVVLALEEYNKMREIVESINSLQDYLPHPFSIFRLSFQSPTLFEFTVKASESS